MVRQASPAPPLGWYLSTAGKNPGCSLQLLRVSAPAFTLTFSLLLVVTLYCKAAPSRTPPAPPT